ncbi:hypothetical protein MMC25_000109 [Agyrium rufum]|nr:hypothetical protein [Agyrium rufum]
MWSRNRLAGSAAFPGGIGGTYGKGPMDPRDHNLSRASGSTSALQDRLGELQLEPPGSFTDSRVSLSPYGGMGVSNAPESERRQVEYPNYRRSSPDRYPWDEDPTSWMPSDLLGDGPSSKGGQGVPRGATGKMNSQRRPSNRDEFDGPHQFLERPSSETIAAQERELPHLPTNLYVNEQDEILSQVNDCLSCCAFDFVAKFQFPIPLEPDKRPVRVPQDREWTEWVYLLKRLATKRRVPARVLYNGQIKQLVTVLENSLEMRHAAKHQSRPLKDDRNVLQLVSAGLQVAKILKDATAMETLDRLYVQTEQLIQSRRIGTAYSPPGFMP